MRFYGSPPGTTYTRLTNNVAAGATTFTVEAAVGWAAGHELVISPSGRNASQYDRRTIKSVSVSAEGVTTVEVDKALSFFHHGGPTVSLTKDLGPAGSTITQSLDLRAVVMHITRNIVIAGTPDDNWGGRVLVYLWMGTGFALRGQVELDGV